MAKLNFYRCGQAAKELGISSYKIRRLAETGLIPDAEFNGAQWHIPVSAIERLKHEGVPALPKVVDIDDEADAPLASQKERTTSTLLAPPSDEMVAAAERSEMSVHELKTAQNNLERNKVRREEAEIEDFFGARQRRLQEQEAAENRRYEEQLEANARTQRQQAARDQRQKFTSKWIEYAINKKPSDAPNDVQLDIHEEVLSALAKLDTDEQDSTVRHLVDGAVERSLKSWKSEKAKSAAIKGSIEEAVAQLPHDMRWYDPWKSKAQKIAAEALKDVGAGVSQEHMESMAGAALQPLIQQFERAGKIQQAVNSVHIDGATYDELREGQELVQEALSALPDSSSNRQIKEAAAKALAPLSERVSERISREETERRRKEVLSALSWRLPREISDDDKESALAEIKEALDDLPADASERDMQQACDEIVQEYEEAYKEKARRAEKKTERVRAKADLVRYGLSQVWPYAQKMLQEFDYDHGETAWDINSRVEGEVQKVLEEELDGRETQQEVGRLVREIMREVEGCR
jgi:hypothetical protein